MQCSQWSWWFFWASWFWFILVKKLLGWNYRIIYKKSNTEPFRASERYFETWQTHKIEKILWIIKKRNKPFFTICYNNFNISIITGKIEYDKKTTIYPVFENYRKSMINGTGIEVLWVQEFSAVYIDWKYYAKNLKTE